jgi:membrane protease YdiL (CAAX protease family)
MERIFRAHDGGFFVVLVLLLSVVPGFVEELLFRGFLQRRMEKRFPALFAIVVGALFFAVSHLDYVHVIGVIPLGLWLGLIAWRTGSVWPAILCHMTNNAVAILVAKRAKEISMEFPMDTLTFGMLVAGGAAFFVSVVLLIQAGPSDERL